MKLKFTGKCFFYLLFAVFVTGCSKNYPEIKWSYSDIDVVGIAAQQTGKIDLDIYIDATMSMEGYALNRATAYSEFLDQLEASALSAWKMADTKYYKFGERVRLIDRNEFLSAKNNPKFYQEQGIKLKTYIDSVVVRTDTKRLSVLITDLFQDEADVNIMVERIKEKCFAKGVMVGIMGVNSEFKGKVYDVPGNPKGYALDTKERPFYAIMFGNPGNMELLFQSLKTKPFVKENQFLIFSPCIIKSFDVSLKKTNESKFLVNNGSSSDGIKNPFKFKLQKGDEGHLTLEINLNQNTKCANFIDKNIELIAFKKSASGTSKVADKDSSATSDISMENLHLSGTKLTATLLLKNTDEPGNYSYLVYLKANPLNGLENPGWITAFSTDKPQVGTASASLTCNLEKFAGTLLVANSTITPTYISKFYLNIYKR